MQDRPSAGRRIEVRGRKPQEVVVLETALPKREAGILKVMAPVVSTGQDYAPCAFRNPATSE